MERDENNTKRPEDPEVCSDLFDNFDQYFAKKTDSTTKKKNILKSEIKNREIAINSNRQRNPSIFSSMSRVDGAHLISKLSTEYKLN